jgi:hypothetical protein
MAYKDCEDYFITIWKWFGGEGIRYYQYLGCNVTQCYRHFGGKTTASIYPADGGSTFLRNNSKFLSTWRHISEERDLHSAVE